MHHHPYSRFFPQYVMFFKTYLSSFIIGITKSNPWRSAYITSKPLSLMHKICWVTLIAVVVVFRCVLFFGSWCFSKNNSSGYIISLGIKMSTHKVVLGQQPSGVLCSLSIYKCLNSDFLQVKCVALWCSWPLCSAAQLDNSVSNNCG